MTYAISNLDDLDTFLYLLEDINFSEKDEMYILGDFITDNKQSINLINFIIENSNIIPIMGIKEEEMLLALTGQDANTINSFETNNHQLYEIYKKNEWYRNYHLDFYKKLPKYVETDDFIFSNIGKKCNVKTSLKKNVTRFPCVKKRDKKHIFAHYEASQFDLLMGIKNFPEVNALCVCKSKQTIVLNLTQDKTIICRKRDRI